MLVSRSFWYTAGMTRRRPARGDRVRLSPQAGTHARRRWGQQEGTVLSIHREDLPGEGGVEVPYVEYGVTFQAAAGEGDARVWFLERELEVITPV